MITNSNLGFGSGILAAPFKKDDGTYDANAIKTHISRQLRVEAQEKAQKSLIEAIQAPDTWLKNRKTEIDNIIATHVTPTFQNALTEYVDTHKYPYDEALALATRRARMIYDIEMEELERRMPGANSLYLGIGGENDLLNKASAELNGGYLKPKKGKK